MRINVNIKQLSKSGRRVKPVPFEYPGNFTTVEEFLKETVGIMYEKFMSKAEGTQDFANVLSDEEIGNMAEIGKIAFGFVYGEKEVTLEKAVETALLAYSDGLVKLFIGNDDAGELDSKLALKDGDEVTFIRLAMLSGRMW